MTLKKFFHCHIFLFMGHSVHFHMLKMHLDSMSYIFASSSLDSSNKMLCDHFCLWCKDNNHRPNNYRKYLTEWKRLECWNYKWHWKTKKFTIYTVRQKKGTDFLLHVSFLILDRNWWIFSHTLRKAYVNYCNYSYFVFLLPFCGEIKLCISYNSVYLISACVNYKH